jgi:MtN3 and saliva related transmembrane protein
LPIRRRQFRVTHYPDRAYGGFCTTIAYLPQVLRIWRTRSTKDISLGMFSVMVLGLFCWLLYGILLGDIPLILSNAVTLVLAGTILFFKLRHG